MEDGGPRDWDGIIMRDLHSNENAPASASAAPSSPPCTRA